MTVEEAAKLVLEDHRRENAATSFHTYRWHAATMIEDFGANTLLQDITRLQVQRWASEMIGKVKAATIRHRVSFLTRLYKKANEHGLNLARPTTDLRLPKVNNKRRKYGTPEHIELLRPVMKPWRLSIVELAFHTGLRRLEIYRLRREDIELFKRKVKDQDGNLIEAELGYATVNESKTGESRVICLNVEATQIVKYWLAESLKSDSEWLIGPFRDPGPKGRYKGKAVNNRLMQAQNFSDALRRACAKVGIELSMHLFRHGFASVAIEVGAEPKHVQFQLGHSTIVQTARYIHHNANAMWPAAFAVSNYRLQ